MFSIGGILRLAVVCAHIVRTIFSESRGDVAYLANAGMPDSEIDANGRLMAAAPLLLEACQYEYNGGQDDDLLMEIESALLSFLDRTVDRKDYYHGLAVKLCAKQKLQAAAIKAALGPEENR